MESLLRLIISITETDQQRYPSRSFATLILALEFIQRLSLLFPFDGYLQGIYKEQYMHFLYDFVCCFNIAKHLYHFESDYLSIFITCIISISIFIFTTLIFILSYLEQLQVINIMNPNGIIKTFTRLIYNVFMYIEFIMFIPFCQLLIGVMMCGRNTILLDCQYETFMSPNLIATLILLIMVGIQVFFFRTYEYAPKHLLRRQYTNYSILIPILIILLIISNYISTYNFTVIRLFLTHVLGITWIVGLYDATAYCPPMNKVSFIFGCQFEITNIMITLAVSGVIEQNKLFFLILVFNTLIFYLSIALFNSQTLIIDKMPNLYSFQLIHQLYKQHQIEWFMINIKYNTMSDKEMIQELMKKSQERKYNEQVNLIQIHFLISLNKVLPAYINLRKSQLQTHSLYFRYAQSILNEKLTQCIIKQQESSQESRELIISEIHVIEKYKAMIIPKLNEFFESKVQFWIKLIQGYQRIEEYKQQAINLSQQLVDLKNSIIENNKSIYIQRISSIFYAICLSDTQKCIQIEQQISDSLLVEQSGSEDLITNSSFINSKSILVSISMIKNKGQIVNSKLDKFYPDQLATSTHINALMPRFIMNKHDQLLDKFLEIGQSKLFSKAQQIFTQVEGYIVPISLKLGNFLDNSDDYILSAVLTKIKEQNNFILFDTNGKFLGITKQLYEKINQICKLPIEKFIRRGFVYILIPDILDAINSQKEDLSQNSDITYDYKINMVLGNEMEHDFQNYKYEQQDHIYQKSVQEGGASIASQDLEFSSSDKDVIQGCSVQLLSNSLRQSVIKYTMSQSVINKKLFQLSYSLKFNKVDNFGYFCMEIHEIKDQDQFTRSLNTNNMLPSSQAESPDRDISTESHNEVPSQFSEIKGMPLPKEPDLRLHYDYVEVEIDQKYAPISKRAQFEAPFSIERKYDSDLKLLDLEIRDLEMSNNISSDRLRIEELSSKQMAKSQQIMRVMTKKEIDNNIQQSQQQSTMSSNSQTRDTVSLLRNLINNYTININLKFVILLVIFQILLQFVLVVVKIQVNNSQATQLMDIINQIVFPSSMITRYNKFSVYGWIHFYQYIGLVNHSQFINNGIMKDTKHNLLPQLTADYSVSFLALVQLEDSGLIQPLKLVYIGNNDTSSATYSYFNFIMRGKYENIVQNIVNNQNNDQFLIDMFFIKDNAQEIYKIIENCLSGLNTLFNDKVNLKDSMNLIFLLIFTSFNVMIFIQLRYWYQISIFNQRILINVARITEQQATQIIKKIKYINASLSTDWIKLDFQKISNITFVEKIYANDKKSTQVLSQRITHTTISNFKEIIIITGLYFIVFVLFLIGYFFQSSADTKIKPSQDLTLKFISYSFLYEQQIYAAFMTKIEYLVIPYAIQLLKFPTHADEVNDSIFINFLNLSQINQFYYLEQIYNSLVSNDISNKTLLTDLYQNSFCLHITNIEFCNFNNSNFIETYGQYNQSDINIDQLSKGMIGQYSAFQELLKQQYDTEINTLQYVKNTSALLQFLNSSSMVNYIIQHYLNYNEAYSLFENTMSSVTISQIQQQANAILYYYIGILLGLCFIIVLVQYLMISRTNWQIHLIRLSVLNLPIEILSDPQMKQFLKIVENN